MLTRYFSPKFVTVIVLSLALLSAGCTKKPATTVSPAPALSPADQIIHDAKVYGPVVAAALEEGIKQEAQMAASGAIPPTLEPTIRQWLQDGKKTVDAFNERAATWTHFDSAKKEDIARFLDDALTFVQKIYDEGILRIKNPQSQSIASGILSGAKVTLILWKSNLQQAAQ